MSEKALKKLAKQYHLKADQVRELLELLGDGYSAPYVLRYRKDLAANLDVDDLNELRQEERRLYNVEKERERILSKLEEQGVLTDDLRHQIESADTMSELIDYYVPYRPRKRSRSRHALGQGLAPLARAVFSQEEPLPLMSEAAQEYVDPEVGLDDVGDVLDGIFAIVCDWMAEEKSHRDKQRDVLHDKGKLVSKKSGRGKGRYRSEFRDYMSFSAPITKVHPYHVLCMMRGKRLKVLRYGVEPPLGQMCRESADLYLRGGAEQYNEIDVLFGETAEPPQHEALGELSGSEFLYWCIRQSLEQVLAPILVRELERQLRREAENLALDIIRRNLRSQLMRRPINDKRVLGFSPGLRMGCQIAVLDENGELLESATVYPHTPRNEKKEARETIARIVEEHDVSVAAIGEGTGSKESEKLLSQVIEESCPDLEFTVLSEDPAKEYAGSGQANRELPGMKKNMRVAVFLGRQMLDPLRELTKIKLRDLCSARYVQEVDGKVLNQTMRQVAEECVGAVGPDLNDAPASHLAYVPGLDYNKARQIVEHRDQKNGFKRRRHLREVDGIDQDLWRRSVGFVRLMDSDTPLDRTRIHPEHYVVAETMLKQMGFSSDDLTEEENREEITSRRGEVKFAELEKQFDVHYLALKDMLDELATPWPDPRMHQEGPVLRQRQLTFEDLEPLQVLYGTVRKVVDFGAFVDVGVSEDGLVHISELSDEFVHSPYDVVSVGDLVKVRVVEVDPERRRIALSMRSEEAARKAARRKARAREEKKKREEERQRREAKAAEVPDAELPSSVGQARSTVEQKSRRRQKLEEYGKKAREKAAAEKTGEEEPAEEEKKEEKKKPESMGDLLDKLDFASIEKRGEQSS
jgi:uncharacterized protein